MENYKIPIGEYGEKLITFAHSNFKPLFTGFKFATESTVEILDSLFLMLPSLAWTVIVAVVVWRLKGWGMAIFAIISFLLIDNQGFWNEMTLTASIVLTSAIFSLVVAFPLGILMAENEAVELIGDAFLDFLITIPRFVILVPAVLLLGIGIGPAVFATMTLAVAPPARIIAVGIKHIDSHVVEAAEAFGANRLQTLVKIKLPLALPSLVLAINQCLLMSLVMAVIAALIGAGGLGDTILMSIEILDAGSAFVAGFGVFALAILLDRSMRSTVDRMSAASFQSADETR